MLTNLTLLNVYIVKIDKIIYLTFLIFSPVKIKIKYDTMIAGIIIIIYYYYYLLLLWTVTVIIFIVPVPVTYCRDYG